ncbi:hypothetical protein Dda_7448 [Drechslerella dactyloides]|uniref:LysM domain-containing protein n=1 Tax=Drechslerella dactyloides TaxID=74499 RepID=A0AAD6ISM8_DREDA|nr:hypothetical protein Dda_7448 [Drechslerella dactyloides]
MYGLLNALPLIGMISGCQAYAPVRSIQARQASTPPAIAGCNKWFTTFAGDTCDSVAAFNDITAEDFAAWNPSLQNGVCNDLVQPDTAYCIGIPQTVPKTTSKPAPPTTTKPAGNGITTPSPIQNGMIGSCNKFHFVADGQGCSEIFAKYPGVTLDLFSKWNPAVGKGCTSMWAKTYVCVGVIGGAPPTPSKPTSAPPSNGTPTPIGANTTKDCKKWAYIRSGDTCPAILERNKDVKSTMKDLIRWNPSIRGDCTGLIAGNYLCLVGPGAPAPGPSKPPVKPTTKVPPKPTPTKPPTNPTPSPVQPGQVKNCKEWAFVNQGQSCLDILKKYPKINLQKLVSWNPAIGKDCKAMWAKTYLCVRV